MNNVWIKLKALGIVLWRFWLLPYPSTYHTDIEWDAIEAELKRKYPIRYFFQITLLDDLFAIRWNLIHAIDWIRLRTVDKQHLVDTRLPPDYYDVQDKMLHASFSLLCEYVENNPFVLKEQQEIYGIDEELNAEATEYQEATKTIKHLYEWWKYDWAGLEKEWDNLIYEYPNISITDVLLKENQTDARFDEYTNTLKRLIEKTNERSIQEENMLIELMKVRKYFI